MLFASERGAGDSQAFVHVLKRLARLIEEIVDYRFAELALLLVVVHFENLSPEVFHQPVAIRRPVSIEPDPALTCSKVAWSIKSPKSSIEIISSVCSSNTPSAPLRQ